MRIDARFIWIPCLVIVSILIGIPIGSQMNSDECQERLSETVVAIQFPPIKDSDIIVRPVIGFTPGGTQYQTGRDSTSLRDLIKHGDLMLFIGKGAPDRTVITLKRLPNGKHGINTVAVAK